MSTQLGTLISFVLKEYFGETIEKVGSFLHVWGSNPLALISKNTGIPIEKTKIALCFLIKHGFVTFEQGRSPSIANYKLTSEKVLLLLRYSRYVANIKKKFGNIAEIIIEQILCQGITRASDAILSAAKRVQQQGNTVDIPLLRDTFFILIVNQYIMRLPNPVGEEKIPVLKISERDLYLHPEIDIKQLTEKFENSDNDTVLKDYDIYWRVNFDRFHQDFRDAIMISAIKRRTDENGGELMRLLLKLMYVRTEPWADVSNPIPTIEIKDVLRTQNNSNSSLLTHLDQYLTIIENDPCKFLMRVGEAGGGQFVVNVKEAFIQLSWATIENIISEKFGSHAARIFRLVRSKKFIEADHIPQLSMMQIKDAKRLTYQLLEENFLQMRELRKVQSNTGPMKTFILFHINIDQVVRMLLDMCYKCVYNLKVRRKHYTTLNKPIIDKKQRADAIELDLKSKVPEDELEEILSELITPAEREMLAKIGATIKKLNVATLDIDNTIFLLQLYTMYTTK